MMSEARDLLQLSESDETPVVRPGDIYSIMIKYLATDGKFQAAYDVMQEMREWNRAINMAFYVDPETIQQIHDSLGIPMGSGKADGEDDDHGIEENIPGL